MPHMRGQNKIGIFDDSWIDENDFLNTTGTEQEREFTPKMIQQTTYEKKHAVNVKVMLGLEWCEFLCKRLDDWGPVLVFQHKSK